MRMLTYGVGADVVDDYLRIGESTAIEAMRRWVRVVGLEECLVVLIVCIGSGRIVQLLGNMGYILHGPLLSKPFHVHKERSKNFSKAQEGCRKDVERAFGVLQARFAIVRGPARFWDRETLQKIMKTCVIMHNMIIEDERAERIAHNDLETLARQYVEPEEEERDELLVSHNHSIQFKDFIDNHLRIRNKETHSMLQSDLVEHLWQRHLARVQ
uniref:uncharacterized protein LOC101290794 n=1 Tax=Fragaria vesca subsp. vesca TaxID=101020 RepID=UPI0005C88BC5|nr:PREDICTED: uncharacterized protein LOC101290794 [Fragaria vesca subsp. vesca]